MQFSESLTRLESFELNPRTGELRKNDAGVVRLWEQPLRILLTFLGKRGELVSREDLASCHSRSGDIATDGGVRACGIAPAALV